MDTKIDLTHRQWSDVNTDIKTIKKGAEELESRVEKIEKITFETKDIVTALELKIQNVITESIAECLNPVKKDIYELKMQQKEEEINRLKNREAATNKIVFALLTTIIGIVVTVILNNLFPYWFSK